MSAVRLESVTKRFGAVTAVDDLDLEIRDGEFFSMLGPSGSGKTTVLRMIAGFEAPTSGKGFLGGDDVTKRAPFARNVNTVFQDYALFPHLDVLGNVEYGLAVKKVPRRERRQRAEEALESVRLGGYGGRKPGQEDQTSFFRKGIKGDWKNHMDAEQERAFVAAAGGLMAELGYTA